MNWHSLFGKHLADPNRNRWEDGAFVSVCTVCGRPMVKPVGGAWMLARLRSGL